MTSYGIDFGTTNCVVAHLLDKRPQVLRLDRNIDADWAQFPSFAELVPSEFGLAGAGATEREVFGWAAKLRARDSVPAVKRLLNSHEPIELGGSLHSVEKVAALLFGMLRAGVAATGGHLDAAAITIPSNSSGKARYRTRISAQMAGITSKALINEPTAAAIAYRYAHEGPESMLVFDFGGGTLDVTILEYVEGMFIERASKGVAGLGGLDFDKRLADLALSRMKVDTTTWDGDDRRAFKLGIERAKIRLSTDTTCVIATPDLQDACEISREEFVSATDDLFQRAVDPVEQCLRDLKIHGLDLDAVLLIGGTSAIPEIRDRVRLLLGQDEVAPELCDPLTAVAQGAAIAAGIRSGEIPDLGFRVVTEHALGTKVTDKTDGQRAFSAIIPRGVPLPYRRERSYTPTDPRSRQVTVEVWEGDPSQPLNADVNVKLKALPLRFPDEAAGGSSFLLEYVYDVDAILHVTATDAVTSTKLLVDDVAFIDDDGASDRREAEIKEVSAAFRSDAPVTPMSEPAAAQDAGDGLRIGGRVVSTTPAALIVDGSNLACDGLNVRGGTDRPSLTRLRTAVEALAEAFPQGKIVVIVDANFRHVVDPAERAAVDEALREHELWEPSAGWDGKADAAVAQLAHLKTGVAVTNDNYHQLQAEFPWLRDDNRVLGMRWMAGDWIIRWRRPTKPPVTVQPKRLPTAPLLPKEAQEPLVESRPVGWTTSHWWSGE